MPEAWMLTDIPPGADPREEYRRTPNVPVSVQELEDIGVFYRHVDDEDALDKLCKERHYVQSDEVKCADMTRENLDKFFTEHLHEDEEIRYPMDGCGYFDVRNAADEWIRIKVSKHDLLIIPAGIYHRFTLTTDNFLQCRRFFQEAPKWVPVNRGAEADTHPIRTKFLESIGVVAAPSGDAGVVKDDTSQAGVPRPIPTA
eukprot:TRINITY_DN13450_c0_g1_i1.p1 TRINITY_DN13450_c0_g1~~TRINITY_DN13450_c0_g1_i1.p1  ORF type:complete len:200 (-),score=26.37 TRINITY_DN13450_c0_g1_i1:78-677(-)